MNRRINFSIYRTVVATRHVAGKALAAAHSPPRGRSPPRVSVSRFHAPLRTRRSRRESPETNVPLTRRRFPRDRRPSSEDGKTGRENHTWKLAVAVRDLIGSSASAVLWFRRAGRKPRRPWSTCVRFPSRSERPQRTKRSLPERFRSR